MNAVHAIDDRQQEQPGPGLITIRTALDGDQAVITVSDNGCGIPDEIADLVYDPFFTTKEVGRGTGQGLALALALALARSVVVKGHRGTISLQSEPMQGTTFVIRLPVRRS